MISYLNNGAYMDTETHTHTLHTHVASRAPSQEQRF